MVLQACFDDSGSSPDEPVMVLAGYIADAENWLTFSDAWKACLDEHPRLEYLKMSEAMGLRGQFARQRGWTADTRNYRLEKLAAIIRTHVSHQVCASLVHRDFQDTLRELPAVGYRTLANEHPYNVLWYKLVSELILIGPEMKLETPIDFIFDQQLGHQEETGRTWDMVSVQLGSSPPWSKLVGSRPKFLDEKEFLPLQAADMLAWLNRRALDPSAKLSVELLPIFEVLEPIPPLHLRVSRDWMMRWFSIQTASAQALLSERPNVHLVYHDPSATKRDRKRQRKVGKGHQSKAIGSINPGE
ncbi:MAG: DUF3800 domain-containing protein [Hyphomonas sp.]